jgi:hypothetical protein
LHPRAGPRLIEERNEARLATASTAAKEVEKLGSRRRRRGKQQKSSDELHCQYEGANVGFRHHAPASVISRR